MIKIITVTAVTIIEIIMKPMVVVINNNNMKKNMTKIESNNDNDSNKKIIVILIMMSIIITICWLSSFTLYIPQNFASFTPKKYAYIVLRSM